MTKAESYQSSFDVHPVDLKFVTDPNAASLLRTFQKWTSKINSPRVSPATGGLSPNSRILGRSNGGLLVIDDKVAESSPHRSVSLVPLEISNTALDGAGINDALQGWLAHSEAATHEKYDDFVVWPTPDAGENNDYLYLKMYEGFIQDGCGKLVNYPIELTCRITNSNFETLGSFSGKATISIKSNALWVFSFPIVAEDESNNRSRFDISGLVSVNCVSELP